MSRQRKLNHVDSDLMNGAVVHTLMRNWFRQAQHKAISPAQVVAVMSELSAASQPAADPENDLNAHPSPTSRCNAVAVVHRSDSGEHTNLLERIAILERQVAEQDQRIAALSAERDLLQEQYAVFQAGEGRALALVRNITERKRVEQKLHHMAMYDTLTGLPNRAFFNDRLQQALDRSTGTARHNFAVLLIDLDNFKRINDSMGHATGDQLLIQLSHRLHKCMRSGDMLARLGGDEFIILLEDVQENQQVLTIVEQICHTLRTPFILDEHAVVMSASIGVVPNSAWHSKTTDLLRDADIALYNAKERGKGQYTLFDAEMHIQVVEDLIFETELRAALEQEELRVYYQPIVNLNTEQACCFEALIRWQHPELGLLTPGQFLPLAEKLGLDVELDRWVLRAACRQLHQWQQQKPDISWRVSINLSSRQFEQSDLVAYVEQVLQEANVQPEQIMLELTERSLIDHNGKALKILTDLRKLGVRIGLDDFGTGYSSLSYLNRFPVDVLKIDRTFIENLGLSKQNSEIVRMLVQLTQSLGLEVVAEGIETTEQLQCLQKLHCHYGQGYRFARPLDPTAAEMFVNCGRREVAPDAIRNHQIPFITYAGATL